MSAPGMSRSGLDILAALEAEPTASALRCKVQLLLDSIPADTPNKDRLVEAVTTTGISGTSASIVMLRLGMRVSSSLITQHRSQRCICFR